MAEETVLLPVISEGYGATGAVGDIAAIAALREAGGAPTVQEEDGLLTR
jgi:hypothetical protein